MIGGVALSLHGSSLVTSDTDILYARDLANVERLATALGGLDVRLRGVPEELPFVPDARTLRAGMNFTFTCRYGDLDILGEVAGLTNYEGVRSRARVMRLDNRDVRVASVDDLIAMKAAAGRPKDLRAIDDLAAIRELELRGE